ncbi:MAG: insulinase family protein [Archangium sp.]|nr:insulinase family protein [Archangium sp.]
MRFPLCFVMLAGCAPLTVGPGRVLPASLQYDPVTFAATPRPRSVEAPRRLLLPNGLEVFWAEDHGSQLVDVAVLVGCGRGDEPAGSPELTGAMLGLIFSAGAGARDSKAQRRVAAELGVDPSVTTDDGESWATFTVGTAELGPALELLRDALASPRFELGAVIENRERWATRFDSPVMRHARLARRTRARAIYGNVPTLSQVATAATVRSITDELLKTHAGLCLQPANLVLSVAGDLTEASLTAALTPLAGLQGSSRMKHLPPAPTPTSRWLWLVPSPLTNKVQVDLLGPGLAPGSPHRAAARVLLVGLLSRLQLELRQQMGHVYSITGDVDVGPGSGATWLRFTTRSEVAVEAVRRTIAIVQSWWERWPFDEVITGKIASGLRLDHHRGSATRRSFEAARARLQDREAWDPRPVDEQLARVELEELRAFFASSLRPDRLQVVISGAFDATLDWEQFGPVTRVQPLQ